MDNKAQEALVVKVFTNQGKLDGLEAEVARLNNSIEANKKEIGRLEALKKNNDGKVAERDVLIGEVELLSKDIDKDLAMLEKEKIILPFGSRKTRQVAL
jgi:hypothetical protein